MPHNPSIRPVAFVRCPKLFDGFAGSHDPDNLINA
ncbi:hypothetical protein Pla144_02480 [Bythopirellula polymerisocia]|uniref:Uncharacterized protein n=1 Tax=Bythopirellula polymerisocia TaxID=2528003 RepID=A0A5C6CY26_9BACT|nr:hypothetical protein Pla144_02480 [Bythopirellula polymerisocia]